MAFRAPRERGGPTPSSGGRGHRLQRQRRRADGPGLPGDAEGLAELKEVATLAAIAPHPARDPRLHRRRRVEILDVFEEVDAVHPIGDLRWAMATPHTGSPETIARMSALGMAFSVQWGRTSRARRSSRRRAEVALRSAARAALDQGLGGRRRHGRHAHRRLPRLAGGRVPGHRGVARQRGRSAARPAHDPDGGAALVHARLRLARLRR